MWIGMRRKRLEANNANRNVFFISDKLIIDADLHVFHAFAIESMYGLLIYDSIKQRTLGKRDGKMNGSYFFDFVAAAPSVTK